MWRQYCIFLPAHPIAPFSCAADTLFIVTREWFLKSSRLQLSRASVNADGIFLINIQKLSLYGNPRKQEPFLFAQGRFEQRCYRIG